MYMQGSSAYNVYKNNSVNYASKEQLLLMLVDGAVKFAKIGRQAIIEKNIPRAHENIVKTQDIFYELMATLDTAKGGEWAKNLYNVYDFVVKRLIDANMKKSIEIMDEILPVIENVRDTWNEAYNVLKASK